MAHELTQHDQMISARNITPWHELGEVHESFEVADLHRIMGWEVQKFRLQTITAKINDKEYFPMDTDTYATVRMPRTETESPIVLGARLASGYKILQNSELIKIVEPFVENGCAIETAGTLKEGARVWIMLRLAKDLHVGNNDVIKQYIMVSNDHTGRQAARFGLVGIRVVCNNTLNAAEADGASRIIRVLHQGNVSENLQTVASMLDHVNGQFTNYAIDLEKLIGKGIVEADLRKYVTNCLFAHNSAERRERHEAVNPKIEAQNKIIELFETGPGSDLPEANGTLYGAYQAVNYYLNHNRDVALATRLPSLVWGNRATTDKRAFQLAMKLAA